MPDFSAEKIHWEQKIQYVVGIDEAGRGPLAGPVSAAAIILPQYFKHAKLNDSKKLSGKQREAIYEELVNHDEILWTHAFASSEEIDDINILKATHLAMARAVTKLEKQIQAPLFCLIDGLKVPDFPYPSESIVKGDSKSLSIAAASIIAKVTRDREMLEYSKQYPSYGFEKHKGYGTKAHLDALNEYGPTPIHRRSFAPVTKLIQSSAT